VRYLPDYLILTHGYYIITYRYATGLIPSAVIELKP